MLRSSSGVVHTGYNPQNERKLSETFVCVNSLMSNKGRVYCTAFSLMEVAIGSAFFPVKLILQNS